jgi:hypothetical protein
MSIASASESQRDNPYLLTRPEFFSAKKKIAHASAFFDPSKTPFDAFECEFLDPTQFREQMRRNFLLEFTDEELGALIMFFDTV